MVFSDMLGNISFGSKAFNMLTSCLLQDEENLIWEMFGAWHKRAHDERELELIAPI